MKADYKWVGKSIARVEDRRLLTGRGRYIDDLSVPGMLHAAVLRSPHAHARIKDVDVSAARSVPGVLAVITGADLAKYVGAMPAFCNEPIEQWALAAERVRYAGEGVAAVAATSRYAAEDACELINVEYEGLPVISDPFDAMRDDAPVLHAANGSNVAFQRTWEFGDPDGAFRRADHVIRRKFRWHRMTAQPTETCGAILSWDPATEAMTAWTNANMFNMFAAPFADMLAVDLSRLKLIPCAAVGGSFGNAKNVMGKVMCIAGALTKITGRPVKFIEDRLDHMLATDSAGPDRWYDAALALTGDGEFLGIGIDVVDDYGAYFHFSLVTHTNALAQPVGQYRIQSVKYSVTAVLTNKAQQGIIRGAGSDVGNFILERLVDAAAVELGIDRVEIRRQNFIHPDQFPYRIPTGNVYDSGDYDKVLSIAMSDARTEYWTAERDRARKDGRYLGVGIATCQERTTWNISELWFQYEAPAFPATRTPEGIRVAIDVMGNARVILGGPTWGNSPETVATQVLAEELGVDPSKITFDYADSQAGVLSPGPGGSRLTVMLAGAVAGAARQIKNQAFKITAHTLEASEEDLEFVNGRVQVKGSPSRGLALAEIAFRNAFFKEAVPEGAESGLHANFTYDHPYTSLPTNDRSDLGAFYPIVSHACHVAVVEVDAETGVVEVLAYLAVSDCGTVMNPPLLEGQIRGGIVQGIGAALSEEYVYDDSGTLLTTTLPSYGIPCVHDVPREFRVLHHETPSPFTQYGVKGGGEGGRMVAPAALASAVEDALRPLGASITEVPITPERVLNAIGADHGAPVGRSARPKTMRTP